MIPCAVGPYKPASKPRTMRYVGDDLPRLKGYTALVALAEHGVGMVVAQFDSVETGYGYG